MLLLSYSIVLLGLLLLPIGDPKFLFMGIGSDKWLHLVLFCGLAALLRWNLPVTRWATSITLGSAFGIAVLFELAQGLTSYRNAEFWDLIAGFLGAILGATGMRVIILFPLLAKPIGLIIASIGLVLLAVALLADVMGFGDNTRFGIQQMAAVAIGCLTAFAGFAVFFQGAPRESYHNDL